MTGASSLKIIIIIIIIIYFYPKKITLLSSKWPAKKTISEAREDTDVEFTQIEKRKSWLFSERFDDGVWCELKRGFIEDC